MIRARVLLMIAALGLPPFAPSSSPAATITREPVSFTVTNPLEPLASYTVRGTLIRPSAGCTRSVLLAVHGLSYGKWAWDFPLRPATYSVAQALAERGYAMVTIDRLGYGSSHGGEPNGYTLTVQGYGEMTAQIAQSLRSGTYTAAHPTAFPRVGLIGHSAGSESVELAAGLHPDVADVLIATAYTHEPFLDNGWLLREWVPGDNVRAAMGDYEYFQSDPATRAKEMHYLPNTEAEVVELDNRLAHLTPSGEIFTISPQPSRAVIGLINIPTLLVLADKDELFPALFGPNEMRLFVSATDKTLLVAGPNNGHAFMLEGNAPVTNAKIADWLDARNAVLPKC